MVGCRGEDRRRAPRGAAAVPRKHHAADRRILLYGRLDALKAGTITDIKFSKKYERGKYIDSTQHPMYMRIVPEAQQFTYLISNGVDVWHETYRRDEVPDIVPTVERFFDWLEVSGYMAIYEKHWLAK